MGNADLIFHGQVKNMQKLLEVREFDTISCNPDFQTEYAYLPEKIFRNLETLCSGDLEQIRKINP